jgi:hypothetical protein
LIYKDYAILLKSEILCEYEEDTVGSRINRGLIYPLIPQDNIGDAFMAILNFNSEVPKEVEVIDLNPCHSVSTIINS